MNKFVIITDSCSGMEKHLREKYDIDYIPMGLALNGESFPADLDWNKYSPQEYYGIMRKGTRFLTSQVTKQNYIEKFEKCINDGFDVLSISASSALSASYSASCLARDELLAKYPNAKIVCVDSLNGGSGVGIECIIASEQRAEGKTIEEVASWLEEHKLEVHQLGTVNDLMFMKKSGRITATKALFGTLFNVKPILISDAKGQNISVGKANGRKNVIQKMAEIFKDEVRDVPYQHIFICQADCMADAEELKALITPYLPNKDTAPEIVVLDPIVGATTGADTLVIYYVGDKVTQIGG